MGKKKFINKKKAATFTLVYRDTAAEDDDGAAAVVPIRQFTRIDGGDSFVPGFSEDDPRAAAAHPEGGDDYYSDQEDEEEGEGEFDEEDVNAGDESRFGDADESADEEERRKGNPKAKIRAAGRRRGLPENVRRELIELGFPDDGYDYNQHMRSIASTGFGGAFVPSTRVADPLLTDIKAYDASKVDVRPLEEFEKAEADEVIELVSSGTRPVRKALSKDGILDADIVAALENSEGSQFDSGDELEDEFVIVANEAAEAEPSRLVENAATTSRRTGQKERPREELDEDVYDSEADDEVRDLPGKPERQRPTRLLDEQFETLAVNDYDDYDEFELEEEDPFARGLAEISQFGDVLLEFLEDTDVVSERYETTAETRRTVAPLRLNDKSGDTDIREGKTADANMVANVGVEDVVLKKTSELGGRLSDEEEFLAVVESEDDRDEWDCETVVSTYSNLENHPARIGVPGRSNPRPKLPDLEKSRIIRLSGKQHLPVDYLPSRGTEDKEAVKAVRKDVGNLGGSRTGETPEEKKARKAAIKEYRKEARLAKKRLKLCYQDDSQRAQHRAATMGPNGIHLP